MFQSLKRKSLIIEKELKCFSYKYKKSTNICKMYLLKIHTRLQIRQCTGFFSYLDLWNTSRKGFWIFNPLSTNYHQIRSDFMYTNNFYSKLKYLGKITENAFLVIADVVGLNPSSRQMRAWMFKERNFISSIINLFPLKTRWEWLNLFSRTIILNLIQLSNIKFQERLLD